MSASEKDIERFFNGSARPGITDQSIDAMYGAPAKPAGPKTHGASRFASLVAHGLPFVGTFSDEARGLAAKLIPGGMDYTQARDAERAKLQQSKEEHPYASFFAQAIPSALVPGGVAGSAMSTGAKALAGGGLGLLQGAAYGAGEAEGGVGDRAKGAVWPAIFGGGIGTALPVAGAVAGSLPKLLRGSPGSRVSTALEEGTGLSRNINALRGKLDDAVEAVRARVYQPLDEAGAVKDADILKLIRSDAFKSHTTAIDAKLAKSADPSFPQLQALRSRLRDGIHADKDLYKQLNTMMQNKLTGLKDADAAYGAAVAGKRLSEKGEKMWNAPAAKIQEMLKGKTKDQVDAFNTGRLFKYIDRLESGDAAAVGFIRKFSEGASTRDRVRELFAPGAAGDQAFKEFSTLVRKENSAREIAQFIRTKWWIPVAGGAAAIGGAGRVF